MKKVKIKIFAIVIIILILLVTFINKNDLSEQPVGVQSTPTVVEKNIPDTLKSEPEEEISKEKTEQPKLDGANLNNEVEKPSLAEEAKESIPKLMCTMSVSCEAILENFDKFNHEKQELVPEDGIIYNAQTVEFTNGESAFDLLLREMRSNNIHIEFEYTPAFDSKYVEGIGNIYEFDCGNMSGWIYKVNGKISDVGSSQYILRNNDKVEWVYVCR